MNPPASPDLNPDRLVSARECLQLGIRIGRLQRWVEKHRLVRKEKQRDGSGRVVYVFRLGDVLAQKALAEQLDTPPEGCITIQEAAIRLNVAEQTVRHLMDYGRLKCGYRKVSAIGRYRRCFPVLADVERLIAEQEELLRLSQPAKPAKPLICAVETECLQARRELWERNGRRINFKKLLAEGKRAG